MSRRTWAGVAAAALACQLTIPSAQLSSDPPLELFVAATGADERVARAALATIAASWRDGFAAMFVDVARFLPSPQALRMRDEHLAVEPDGAASIDIGRPDARSIDPLTRRGAGVRRRITAFLESQTGERFGDDLRAWRRWMWRLPYAPHDDYATFKGELYARLDPGFRRFFPARVRTAIRLDEIDWGGVRVNQIPPLRSPKTVPAESAAWLDDDHLVFGVEVNGEARAYPKRILAWHELASDRVGGIDLTIVYCTLCGTVIPYESAAGGRTFAFGTSGLLYRSNKLMFDEGTGSLWSALDGTPVVGPLVGSGLRLAFRPAVTTTWREWRHTHAKTTVLSIVTGFDRDYSEGAAYRDYFASDRLMFEVPATDSRLKNKAEVVVLRRELIGPTAAPVAIAADLLRRRPVYNFEAAGKGFVVITSRDGANRMYERGTRPFVEQDSSGRVKDADGDLWNVTADSLIHPSGGRLRRVPSHRAFWFGWYAQHPDTVLYR